MAEQNAVIESDVEQVDTPEYEALAKEIATKYGLKHIHLKTREIVATYEFIRKTVSADHIPLVFAAAVENAFKF